MTLLDQPLLEQPRPERSTPVPRTRPAAEEPHPRTEAEWRLADTDFWVASYQGYFGGTIDRQGDHFFVRDTFARYVGDFSDLAIAKRKLEDHLECLLAERRDRH
ncbi:hypothetical protein [Mycetocola miduiensis]|uniref:Uncharacterized protein n=1 Tax=Mycetocola miduiensis TaxID=995034 RepID=A0A1I5B5L2_9MICO|nr:hypothetical protein [Mycetocola miduiensis]SFN69900.1 hypothetical protein SAMN05216219_1742 [Mycetocola miduiensis]